MQYTVSQLAKMFKISRTTVYNKLEHEDLKDYVHDTEQGKRLDIEGLGAFKVLLSSSKVNVQMDTNSTYEKTINEQYIDSLKEQITFLKKELEEQKAKNDVLLNMVVQRDTLLLESAEQKKKGLFKRLFG